MAQYANSVKNRRFTGHGFYTNFSDIDPSLWLETDVNDTYGNVSARLNDECDVGFVLFVRDGKITFLEGYTYGDDWPETIDKYSY